MRGGIVPAARGQRDDWRRNKAVCGTRTSESNDCYSHIELCCKDGKEEECEQAQIVKVVKILKFVDIMVKK